jgi:hypothetical protein
MGSYLSLGPLLGTMVIAIARAIAASRRPTRSQSKKFLPRPAHDRTLLRKLPLGHAVELVSATVERAPTGMPKWYWRLKITLDPLPGTSGELEQRSLTIYSDTSGPDTSPAGVLREALKFAEWGTVEPLS